MLKNYHQMYENSDTATKTENYTFDKNDTNYVKYLHLGATMFLWHETAYALLGMNMCTLQNNSPAWIANYASSPSAEQVV